MTPGESDIISEIRIELAALSRDMAHLQREITEIRTVFSRLVWLIIVGLMGAVLRFALEGGLSV